MADFIGHGLEGLPGGTSCVYTTPFPVGVGTRARDTSGYEYVFCDFTGAVNLYQPVVISSDFTAAAVGITGRGAVGIVCAQVGTSNNGGWVQIYGRSMMQLAGGDGGGTMPSPSDAANGPTTLATSIPTVFKLGTSLTSPPALAWVSGNTSTGSGIYVEGMVVATDASPGDVSAVTYTTDPSCAHTGSQIAVFLNYPVLVHRNYGE
jgi:hypothetical protein